MNDIAEILESELEDAFEVKDKKSLHRYVRLMVNSFTTQAVAGSGESRLEQRMDTGFSELREDVQSVVASMREGFARMDARFEATDQRFEDMSNNFRAHFEAVDRRFDDMNKRFEAVDRRFEAVDRRFAAVDKRFGQVIALMSVFFTVLAGMMTALRIFF